MARQHNSKETKEIIINSAIENFMDKGYSNTTLEDIVNHIGLTRGAFYWNFKSKKDLLNEIIYRYERFYLDIYDSYQHKDSAYQTLQGFLFLDLQRKNTVNPYTTIIRYKVEANKEMSDIKERQARLDNRFLKIITDEISRGQMQGEFRTDKAPDLLSMILYTFLLGFDTFNTVHYSAENGQCLPENVLEEYVSFLLDTLI